MNSSLKKTCDRFIESKGEVYLSTKGMDAWIHYYGLSHYDDKFLYLFTFEGLEKIDLESITMIAPYY